MSKRTKFNIEIYGSGKIWNWRVFIWNDSHTFQVNLGEGVAETLMHAMVDVKEEIEELTKD